ncbi:MAG: ABC transporter transmembrane domain-containing protein, partial [Devosia sp.]
MLSLALPLLSGALLLLQAWLLAHVLGEAIAGGVPLAGLVLPIALFGGVLAVRIGLGLAGEICAASASEAIKRRLRGALTSAILAKPPVWTAARSGGALSSLVVEQVEAMDGHLTRYLPAMAQAAILPLAFAVAVFPVDWMVGVLFLVTAPLIPVFMA